jgi:quercetin dioxygenase-like cupin family protein
VKTIAILLTAALAGMGGYLVLVAPSQATGITRTDLQRHDLGTTGREVIQVRVALAPGVSFGKHTHPGEEIIYMLEGTLTYEVEGRPPVTLKAGEVLFIPAGVVHAASNPGSTSGAELATYVLEKGKPVLTMVP